VIEVQQQGAHPLDVRLVGCEGENPYVLHRKGGPHLHHGCYANTAAVKQSQLPKLKHKFKGTDAEWEAVLAHFLLQQPLQPEQAKLLHGVGVVSTLKTDKLQLSVRQHVQGIKARQHPLSRQKLI
jgi:hypothetical protein